MEAGLKETSVGRTRPAIRAAQAATSPTPPRVPTWAAGEQSLSTGRGATKWMNVGRLLSSQICHFHLLGVGASIFGLLEFLRWLNR